MKRFLVTMSLVVVAAAAFGSDDVAVAAARGDKQAIQELRARGQAGLEALLAVKVGEAQRETWRAAVEQVAKQRDAHVSRLYWYTDFEQAKSVANQSGKPILSLRLLGNLDEEFSCANSRYFRTVLYANLEVRRYLREHFVLHWKSVRPVPRLTIDFGDGRKMETTVTGNSVHYVLDSDGKPIDVIPGLYGPKAFLRVLRAAAAAGDVREFHAARLQKAFVFEPDDWRLDASSQKLIRAKLGNARAAGRLAMSKMVVEDPLLRVIASFEHSLEEDTRHNETVLHRQVDEWFVKGQVEPDVERLNNRVYAELFLTPNNDPWLGLRAPDAYTALEMQR